MKKNFWTTALTVLTLIVGVYVFQVPQAYASSQTVLLSGSSWMVPAGVTSVKVWVVGAGGGGGGSGTSDSYAGGGGGGVAYKTYTVTPGQSITYSLGAGGTGGVYTSGGSPGGNTTATYGGVTITANGAGGGGANNNVGGFGGAGSGGDGAVTGGAGQGVVGDTGGGYGSGIGGAVGANGGTVGGTGANAADVSGLFATLAAVGGYPTTAGGTPGTSAGGNNDKNGGSATGFGCGGGGAGWYGGTGGNGLYGGGGGGAATVSNISLSGGTGGQGVVIISWLWLVGGKKTTVTVNIPVNIPTIDQGIVGHWTFDGKDMVQNAKDSSGQGNNGNLVGYSAGTTTVAGKVGQALKFNGSSQYVSTPDSSSLRPGTVTISFWMNASSINAATNYTHLVFKLGASGKTSYGVWIKQTTGVLYGETDSSSVVFGISGTTVVPTGKWVMATLTYDGTNQRIYYNGIQENVANIGSVSITYAANPLTLATGSFNQNFNGSFDDVRIYNRALSAAEVLQLYNSSAAAVNKTINIPTIDTGIVGHWTFDGKDMVQNVADSSGQGNNGNLVGYSAGTTTVAGKVGQALKFNGTSQYASRSSVSAYNFGTGDFSVSFWMNPKTWGQGITEGLVGQKTNDSTNGWQIYQNSIAIPGKIAIRLTLGNDFLTNANISNDKWTHATFVRQGTNLYWYVNSALDNSSTGSYNLSDSGTFNIGFAQTWSGYYQGNLDDVRIYNRALSAAEVKQLYNSSKATLK